MPSNKFVIVFANGVSGNVPAAGTEGVITSTPPLSPAFDNQPILVFARIEVTPGAAVTNIQLKLRRGVGIAGTDIFGGNTANISVTAGAPLIMPIFFVDSPGIVAGQQYSLTAIATGGAAGSVVQASACLFAMCL